MKHVPVAFASRNVQVWMLQPSVNYLFLCQTPIRSLIAFRLISHTPGMLTLQRRLVRSDSRARTLRRQCRSISRHTPALSATSGQTQLQGTTSACNANRGSGRVR